MDDPAPHFPDYHDTENPTRIHMTLHSAQRSLNRRLPQQASAPDSWKRVLSDTLQNLHLIPDKFNGKVVVSFKDGGISYLEKSETFK